MAKTVEQIASDLNLSVTTVRLVLNGKAEPKRVSMNMLNAMVISLIIPLAALSLTKLIH